MNLDELLGVFDRAAANLARLDAVWARAHPLLPTGPAVGSSPEYDDLQRAWHDLLSGLPPIDGWRVDVDLPDKDRVGQDFIDYAEISEPPFALYDELEQPARQLAEYRYRLHRARRRAVQQRLQVLVDRAESTLAQIVPADLPPEDEWPTDQISGDEVDMFADTVSEIERLLGDTVERRGRWAEMHRHLRFSQPHDWRDIAQKDWPSVRADLESAAFSDLDPLPVPDLDLGEAATAGASGAVSTAIAWSKIDDETFERLLFDLLRSFSDHENVMWLTATRAPDRGRDLSLDRVLRDQTGSVRRERVIVQAKHWTSKSVNAPTVADTLAAVQLWTPPVVHVLIIATSGRFTTDAVQWVEVHNQKGVAPMIEMWPDSRLESLLSQRPQILAAFDLR